MTAFLYDKKIEVRTCSDNRSDVLGIKTEVFEHYEHSEAVPFLLAGASCAPGQSPRRSAEMVMEILDGRAREARKVMEQMGILEDNSGPQEVWISNPLQERIDELEWKLDVSNRALKMETSVNDNLTTKLDKVQAEQDDWRTRFVQEHDANVKLRQEICQALDERDAANRVLKSEILAKDQARAQRDDLSDICSKERTELEDVYRQFRKVIADRDALQKKLDDLDHREDC